MNPPQESATQRVGIRRQGKPAIAVPSLDKLRSVIDTVITAVRNGELDQQLAQASTQTNPRKPKGKRTA